MPAWNHWLQSPPVHPQIRQTQAEVEAVRLLLLHLLDDCEGFDCERLRWRLHTCECAQDLWLLRGAIFQAVSTQHCQEQATERINELVPAFERVLPGRASLIP
jgi:hypothetical protein